MVWRARVLPPFLIFGLSRVRGAGNFLSEKRRFLRSFPGIFRRLAAPLPDIPPRLTLTHVADDTIAGMHSHSVSGPLPESPGRRESRLFSRKVCA